MTATAMTMMPMPPSHCSNARHKRMPAGASSSPVITVAPVVVIPDMASKKASVKLRFRSAKAKGRAAKQAITSQLRVVSRKAWRREKFTRPIRLVRIRVMPTKKVTPAEAPNTLQPG